MFPSWLAADVGSSSEAVSCSAYNVTFLEWRSQGSWIFIVSIPQSKSLKDIRWKFHGLFWPTLRCPTVSFYCMTLTRSESKAAPDSSLRGGILQLLMGRDIIICGHMSMSDGVIVAIFGKYSLSTYWNIFEHNRDEGQYMFHKDHYDCCSDQV